MISRRLLRIKVIKALYAHISAGSDSVAASEKNLIHSINKTYELYYLMLTLPTEIARYRVKVIETGKSKLKPTEEDLNPNMLLVENPLIAQLSGSYAIKDFLEKQSLSWARYPELIKSLYNSVITSDYYQAYVTKEECSYEDHKEFLKNFYCNEIEDCALLQTTLEEQSIFWVDDIEYAASHALKTIATMKPNEVIGETKYKELKLLPLYKDPDDAAYARKLFVYSINAKSEIFSYIEPFTHNWDVERIAFMDKVILLAAITEIKTFGSIPLVVSLDEYIEIAKYYSTTNSSNFINGVLDRVIADLTTKRAINKTLSRKN